MVDIVGSAKRSKMMAGVRSKNSRPETYIRQLLHKKGFGFRIHCKDLPGQPDIKLAKYKAALFVHGCFWHGHDCHNFSKPKTRERFWMDKIETNRKRDKLAVERLSAMGWRVLIVWECALKGKRRITENSLQERLEEWLVAGNRNAQIDSKGISLLEEGN